MTEKRFTLEEFGLNFIVNDNGRNLTAKQTVDELNELNDENIELHIKNDFLKDENQHMRDLVNENKQLKKELRALRKKYNDFSDTVDKRLEELYK